MATATAAVIVIGNESVGKSQLVASLTGHTSRAANFRGSTIACETYEDSGREFVDTPGILRQSDSVTTREALARLVDSDTVLLVAKATHLDSDLADLLPLVVGKRGVIVVTFWDKVRDRSGAAESLSRISRELEVEIIAVDARRMSVVDRSHLRTAIDEASAFPVDRPRERAGWLVEPRRSLLDARWVGPLLALVILFIPAVAAVWIANGFAAAVEPLVQRATAGLIPALASWPSPLK